MQFSSTLEFLFLDSFTSVQHTDTHKFYYVEKKDELINRLQWDFGFQIT